MDEYKQALQKLSDAVEDTMREHYKELGCCSVTRARLDEAKALLARPEPQKKIPWLNEEDEALVNECLKRNIGPSKSRLFGEPAAAEKAREPEHPAIDMLKGMCHMFASDMPMDPGECPGCDAVNEDLPNNLGGALCVYHAAAAYLRKIADELPSPPAATGETES